MLVGHMNRFHQDTRSKMCSFNASIGLLPLILIVSSNEDEL